MKGRIAKPVEYQDARGFVWQAEKMIESDRAGAGEEGRGRAQAGARGLAELKKAWPDRDAAEDAGEGLRRRAERRLAHRACRRQVDVNGREAAQGHACGALIAAFLCGALAGGAAALCADARSTSRR